MELKIHTCLMALLLALAFLASAYGVSAKTLPRASSNGDVEESGVNTLEKGPSKRLAGIFVKDGNENGQLRFLAAGLSSSGNSNNINSALNQYITQKQDMLEQLRPVSTSGTVGTLGTLGTATVTGTGTATGTGAVTTSANGAIYVNLGSSSGSSSTSSNAALNQAIYGGSPVADLLPQVIASAALQNGNLRRRTPANRRRVANRVGNTQNRRRGNKRGKKRPQVLVVRPNRG
ncbi:uncharacterized protein LOC115633368 [Scaptodrosophila lebanonensis]|uniref:Uncharacterized protein LOC115633368 n=1 Tax=Drosophila lebanonensis TaxID=7225 RepID=A0A6J2UHM9_DROLE|nr:uncharacterized protein LOC115633368 [Scaptodrosophila lebanonensis]